MILSVLCGSGKGAVSKGISKNVRNTGDNLFVNAIRMVLCVVISFLAAVVVCGVSPLACGARELMCAFLSGASLCAFMLLWMVCVRQGALVLIDVFLTAGVVVPMIGGVVFFDEIVSARRWVGFLILLAGVFVLCGYNNSIKETKLNKKQLLLLILCGTANGFTAFSQKLFTKTCENTPNEVFNFYTYVFGTVIFLLLLFIRRPKVSAPLKTGKTYAAISLVSVLLYLNLFFQMCAARVMTSAQIYPLAQGLAIFNSSMIAMIFFGERINRRAVIGMVISFAGLLCINL